MPEEAKSVRDSRIAIANAAAAKVQDATDPLQAWNDWLEEAHPELAGVGNSAARTKALPGLKKEFAAWYRAQKAAPAAPAPTPAPTPPPPPPAQGLAPPPGAQVGGMMGGPGGPMGGPPPTAIPLGGRPGPLGPPPGGMPPPISRARFG